MKTRGFMLLEVVLALSIFIVAVVGLIKSLNAGLTADYEQQRLTTMRHTLQSLLDEAMALPPASIATERPPDLFQISYSRVAQPADVTLSSGKKLEGLTKITVTAHDTRRGNQVIGTLFSYVSP